MTKSGKPDPIQTSGTVFVVEDDPSIRALCGRILQGAGLEPVLFDNAAEALRSISDKTGCLVTDLNMPKMGGLELLRAILGARPELPVLAMTGSAPPDELEEIRKLGVEVLSKPFRPEEFVSRVRACLAASIGLSTPRPRRLRRKGHSPC